MLLKKHADEQESLMRETTVLFLDVFAKYCNRYFGPKGGASVLKYYCDNHNRSMTMENYPDVEVFSKDERFFKIHFIVKKIETDTYFNDIDIYHIKWPNHIEKIDFQTFIATCRYFYENLGECKTNGTTTKLAFDKKILELLEEVHLVK